MQVVVAPSVDAACAAAADDIASHLREAVTARGAASLALSGGTTPVAMIRMLADCDLDWSRVELFQVDERVVPIDDPARNWSLLRPLVTRGPPPRLHPMPVEADDGDVRYGRVLADVIGRAGVLDVVHLGLGVDGHTASLVPGDQVVEVSDRDVAWVGEYRGHRRLTLTAPVLRAAAHQVWLVAGADKAAALGELVDGRSQAPAARVVGRGAAVLADATAAAGVAS